MGVMLFFRGTSARRRIHFLLVSEQSVNDGLAYGYFFVSLLVAEQSFKLFFG